MNRRNFLKSFSAAVTGAIIAAKMPLSTPVAERVIAAKEHYASLTEVYELKVDRFNVIRIPRYQWLLRQKSFEAKGYTLQGSQIVYTTPKWFWDEEEWDSE